MKWIRSCASSQLLKSVFTVTALLFVGLLSGACVPTGPIPSWPPPSEPTPPPRPPDPEFERAATKLLPASALPFDVLMQQRIEIRWGDRSDGFDAAVQKRGGQLTLMGLGPFSTRAFTLVLDGRGEVAFERHIDREIPFVPEHILADVQRVFYPWFDKPAECHSCERTTRIGGLEIDERIGESLDGRLGAGLLEERRFRLLDYPERGEVVIRYESGFAPPGVPRRATLENGWFGYRLEVETSSARKLDR